MNLDERARRAADDLRREIDEPWVPPARTGDPFDRFERSRARRARNQRIATVVVASALAGLTLVFVVKALGPDRSTTPASLPGGRILYGEWNWRLQEAHWFTASPDGSARRDLGVVATCAEWFPDGNRIFVTSDADPQADPQPGAPLRPAVIRADGSGLSILDGTRSPDLNLGCGDVSPDGTRIVLEGFARADPASGGIYSVRSSDGGGLHRLTHGPDSYPQFAPDGQQVVFMRTKHGLFPDGAGALFVVDADGGDARRITQWGAAFIDQAWSPNGRWIVFQRPYGRLFIVHPDGSDLHEVPVDLPTGSGAQEPSWSPDGTWIVFSLSHDDQADLYVVRPDGTGLTRLTDSPGAVESGPDWGP